MGKVASGTLIFLNSSFKKAGGEGKCNYSNEGTVEVGPLNNNDIFFVRPFIGHPSISSYRVHSTSMYPEQL